MTSTWLSLLWFVLILALIPACLWLLKRTGRVGGLASSAPGAMRMVQSLSVGAQQRVVTIEVGTGAERRWLVLGVTPQQIRTLHTLDNPPSLDAGPAAPLPTWLARWQPTAQAPADLPGAHDGR